MANSQSIMDLARAAHKGDHEAVVIACRHMIAREKPESRLRQALVQLLQNPSPNGVILSEVLPNDIKNLVLQIAPKLPLTDVMLPVEVSDNLFQLIKERVHLEALKEAGLSAPHKILLSGPPGNGKTALAGAIATKLELPFFVLDYNKAIGSHLGETGSNLAKVFRSLNTTPCVLFIDEMETVLTERNGSKDDVGEMARIVSSLLLEIDRLPDNVVLIGATNHSEMLDRAVIRRFEHHWELPAPSEDSVDKWLEQFSERHPTIPVTKNKKEILEGKKGWSFSDIERSALAWCRQWVVENKVNIHDLEKMAG